MLDRPLTSGQLEVLTAAARPGGIKKGEMASSRWRNLDQLEVRGFVTQNFGETRYGAYYATDAGILWLMAVKAAEAPASGVAAESDDEVDDRPKPKF